jgi:hypothetical protein
VADGVFQQDRIAAVFEGASSEIPADIRAFVTEKLTRYPEE